jgi:ATP-dependent DNA helicase RecG
VRERAPRTLASLDSVSVEVLRNVGPRKANALTQMGITTVLDLVTHYPRRHVDRTRRSALQDMAVGEEATVLARVRSVSARRIRGGRVLVEVTVTDGSAYLTCSFFNQPWRSKQLRRGQEVFLNGRLEMFRGRRRMTNPVVDLIGDRTGKIVPVYPQSDKAGLSTWELGGWIEEALRRAGRLVDPLPDEVRERLGLLDRTAALNRIHFPSSMEEVQGARRRLVLDELLRLQVALVMRRRARQERSLGIRHVVEPAGGEPNLLESFKRSLPFELTPSQEKALAEILSDLASPHPMHRLLQGDVGSGKTVIAVAALLVAVQGGHQGALMAPTEVLAEQHHLAVRELLDGLRVPDPSTLLGERPLRVALLTNRTTAGERAEIHASLRRGQLDLLVGTHALLTEDVRFSSLGVIVVDEQHRFGVEQRAALRRKGAAGGIEPDTLVMTATPIPRTAAMTVFGDLETTVIAELPPGRRPVETVWALGEAEEAKAWRRVMEEARAGRQAYVVCPLVEESEAVQARAATEEFERLRRYELEGATVELVHGQMAAGEKEAAMDAFRAGRVSVLVTTTVIEVGVDVPNATVMVVEDADRFGMAQLHQLRGRVGRGSAASWCYLLGGASTPEAGARLQALVESANGFELAEKDLDLRGEGAILGTRQKGRSDLKLASLRRDRDVVELARSVAEELVQSDPDLSGHPNLRDEIRYTVDEEEERFLFES